MKRVLLLLAACAGIAVQGPAQVDSLRELLASHQEPDSVRIDALLTLSMAIVPRSPDEAKRYADEALALSERTGWQEGIARSYRMLGYHSYIVSDFVAAVGYNQQAEKAAELWKNRKFQGSLYNNMGLVYLELSRFDEARESFTKYLAIARELAMRREQAIALMNTGLAYFKQDRQDEALDYFTKSLAIAEEGGFRQVVTYTLSNMGAALNKKGEFSRGLEVFQRAVQLADTLGDTRIKVQSVGGMGESNFHLKNYDKAEQYSLQALALAESTGLLEYQKEMYEGLSLIYQNQNKYNKAFEAYKNYILLRDSILNDQKKQELTKKELEFAFEKKEAVLTAQHDAEIKRQEVVRNAVAGGSAVLLLGAAVSFVFYKKKRDADERTKEAELQALISDTEMKALRAQMNPHFIFNSLNSIGDYIAKHDMDTADYYLTKFAKLMRMILENSEKKEVTLTDDLKALESYMQLEMLRLNKKFSYEIRIDPTIDRESTLIPPLLLQPFVENSIWHGIAGKSGEGKIAIRIVREGEMIRCIVEDDGVGRREPSASSDPEKQSFGVRITNARIDLLNRIRQSRAKLELSDLPEGTRVEVTLPLVLQS